MFDIGFFELALIGVIALLVVGPERLPKVARTAGGWIKRTRSFVGSVQQDIEREIHAEELKKALEQAKSLQKGQIQASLKETQNNMGLSKVVQDTQQTIADIKQQSTTLDDNNQTSNGKKQAET